MESKSVTLRVLAKKKQQLVHRRLLSYHLLHPEMKEDMLHPSRRELLPFPAPHCRLNSMVNWVFFVKLVAIAPRILWNVLFQAIWGKRKYFAIP